MPEFGIIHYNFGEKRLEEFLDYAAETGFTRVELSLRDVWDESEMSESEASTKAEAVQKMLEVRGLAASGLASLNDFVYLDISEVKSQVKRMEAVGRIARILGTDVLRTEGGKPKPEVPEDRWADALTECLKRCRDFAERDGLYLAVDNHGLVTNDAELQATVFRRVDSPHVGANLDTMNYRWFGHDLDTVRRAYEIVAPFTLHTHFKDGTGSRKSYTGTALGEGEVDLPYAVECLKKAGYKGVWAVEFEGRTDRPAGFRKGLEWLQAHV